MTYKKIWYICIEKHVYFSIEMYLGFLTTYPFWFQTSRKNSNYKICTRFQHILYFCISLIFFQLVFLFFLWTFDSFQSKYNLCYTHHDGHVRRTREYLTSYVSSTGRTVFNDFYRVISVRREKPLSTETVFG